ncbi:MAG: HAMP domain-containing sensor histidine kinase [Solirubrobacterales bacterium]
MACVLAVAASRRASTMRTVAHVAHELRGALGAADLCLASMSRPGRELADPRSWARDIRLQLERATWAVEDLDRLRGSVMHVPAEPVELGALVQRRIQAWMRLAALSDVRLELDWRAGGTCVQGSARGLCQALDNLVSNAITHGRGDVLVRAVLRSGVVRIEIDDGGPGPSAGSVRRRASRLAPHGHGLTIARRAIDRCGGRLHAGHGGVMVTLPVRSSVADRTAPSAA